jgi:rod shape determining protein RodA
LWLRFTAHIDPPLMLGIALLMLTSLMVLYSADNASFGQPLKQMVNIAVGLTFMWIIANLPLHYLMRTAVPIYVLGVLLLIGVALFGEISHGARRWLNLGFMNFQPSELMKVGVPLMMAWYFERRLKRPVPDDLAEYAGALGFGELSDFLALIAAEYATFVGRQGSGRSRK